MRAPIRDRESRTDARFEGQQPAPLPEIRVVRYAALNDEQTTQCSEACDIVDEARLFIEHVGRRNRAVCTTYSLGTVAVTLLSESEVQRILSDSRKSMSHREELRFRSELGASLRGFMRKEETHYRFGRAQELHEQMAVAAAGFTDDAYPKRYDPLLDEWVDIDNSGWDDRTRQTVELGQQAQFELDQYPFGLHVAKIDAFRYFANKRWGFDHGSSEELLYERNALLKHLRHGERLTVGAVQDNGYVPHATIVQLRGDKPDTTVLTHTLDLPRNMLYLPPMLEGENPITIPRMHHDRYG